MTARPVVPVRFADELAARLSRSDWTEWVMSDGTTQWMTFQRVLHFIFARQQFERERARRACQRRPRTSAQPLER